MSGPTGDTKMASDSGSGIDKTLTYGRPDDKIIGLQASGRASQNRGFGYDTGGERTATIDLGSRTTPESFDDVGQRPGSESGLGYVPCAVYTRIRYIQAAAERAATADWITEYQRTDGRNDTPNMAASAWIC